MLYCTFFWINALFKITREGNRFKHKFLSKLTKHPNALASDQRKLEVLNSKAPQDAMQVECFSVRNSYHTKLPPKCHGFEQRFVTACILQQICFLSWWNTVGLRVTLRHKIDNLQVSRPISEFLVLVGRKILRDRLKISLFSEIIYNLTPVWLL